MRSTVCYQISWLEDATRTFVAWKEFQTCGLSSVWNRISYNHAFQTVRQKLCLTGKTRMNRKLMNRTYSLFLFYSKTHGYLAFCRDLIWSRKNSFQNALHESTWWRTHPFTFQFYSLQRWNESQSSILFYPKTETDCV